jgi:hypothetical protein
MTLVPAHVLQAHFNFSDQAVNIVMENQVYVSGRLRRLESPVTLLYNMAQVVCAVLKIVRGARISQLIHTTLPIDDTQFAGYR